MLASGSGGNCTVLRTPAGVVLIDAGLGPRLAEKRMRSAGVRLDEVRAICLTHLDFDHFRDSWCRTIIRRGIGIHCHRSFARELGLRADTEAFHKQIRSFNGDDFEPLEGLIFTPIRLAHDRLGSHGFVIEGFGCRIGYATDLGHVPDHLLEQFDRLNVLALESNYDPGLQLASARPWFLKRRIMGGSGHLSNEQAFEAIRRILDRAEESAQELPSHIVLLHRSEECNCPRLVRKLFARDERMKSRLMLAEQHQRTKWIQPRPSMSAASSPHPCRSGQWLLW